MYFTDDETPPPAADPLPDEPRLEDRSPAVEPEFPVPDMADLNTLLAVAEWRRRHGV